MFAARSVVVIDSMIWEENSPKRGCRGKTAKYKVKIDWDTGHVSKSQGGNLQN